MNDILNAANLWGSVPLLALTTLAVVLLIADLVLEEDCKGWTGAICGVGLLLCAGIVYRTRLHTGRNLLGGSIDLDAFSTLLTLLIIVSGVLTVLMAPGYMRSSGGLPPAPFYSLLVFAITGGALMTQASDLITFFIGLETLSLTLYLMVGLQNRDLRSPEASIKYFLMGAVASAIMLYGIALIYGATGTVRYPAVHAQVKAMMDPWLDVVGLALIILGFLFKIGSVPTHMWVPDVYEGAPTPVTAFLASGVKVAAYGAMLKFLYVGMATSNRVTAWIPILSMVSIITMIYANFAALAQVSLKRLLAYSSIAHSGYLLVAVLSIYKVTDASGRPMYHGGEAVLFYLISYTFMTIGAFLCLSWVGRRGEHLEYMDEFRGLAYKNGWAAAGLSFFMLSLAGMPPTGGFTAKYFAFGAAVRAGHYPLAVIGVLTSLVSVYYYFRIIILMYMADPEQEFEVTQCWPGRLCMLVCVAGVLVMGVAPACGWKYAKVAAGSLWWLSP